MVFRKVPAGSRGQRAPVTTVPVVTPDAVFLNSRDIAVQRTRDAAQAYRRRFINDDELALLSFVPRQSEASVTQTKGWLIALWKECYRRAAAVNATDSPHALDATVNDDYSAVGEPPHTVEQIVNRK